MKDPWTSSSGDEDYNSITDSSGEAGLIPEIKIEMLMTKGRGIYSPHIYT